MTILTLNRKQLESKIGKITKEMQNKIDMFGTPIEEINDNEISIEIFPNRPDLLSFQGFSRALNSFLHKPKIPAFIVNKPEKDYKVTIEKSVKQVRPYTACAIIKNLKFTEEKIKEIIALQEKLHASYGRNRKKLAIGVYPLEKIKLPITFLALPPEQFKFQPLEFSKEITGRQILSQHPTGREYRDLLKNAEVFPIFQDSAGEILSMPPIINSEKTGKINNKTREVFIECSGFNKNYLQKTLNMIVTALSDMGGKIYAMEIEDKEKGNYNSPNLDPEKLEFSLENLNKTLGLELSEKEIKNYLGKMGIGYVKEKNKNYALIPCYRTDILHEIDLSEEVAIAYGYDNFKPEIPAISTIGEEDKTSIFKKKLSEILIGLGLLEVSGYHLSTKEKQFKKIGIKEFKNQMIEVEDSKTENNVLRTLLLANSIQILSENSDSAYPQNIFELGKTFQHDDNYKDSETGIKETEKLCISLCSESANFTEIKQVLDYLFRVLNLEYKIEETSHPFFIEGRCGSVIVKNKKIGFIGEVNPTVIKNNKIKMPVVTLEIEIEGLKD